MSELKRIVLFATPLPLIFGIWFGIRNSRHALNENSTYVRVLAYDGTLGKGLLDEYKKQFKMTVLLDTVVSPAQMAFHLRENPDEYDVIIPYGHQLANLRDATQISDFDLKKLPQWQNVSPDFMNHKEMADLRSLPILWGVEGFLYDPKHFGDKGPSSWKDLLVNKAMKKHLAITENPLEIYASLLRRKVVPSGALESGDNRPVLSALRELVNFADLRDDNPVSQLLSGQYWAIQISSGRAAQPLTEHHELRFMIPEERATLWTQNAAIPVHARHPHSAYQFINFLLTPEWNKLLIKQAQQATTLQALDSEKSLPESLKASYVRKLPLSRVQLIESQLSDHASVIEKWMNMAQSKSTE